jgi:hypothetical protein
MEAVAAACIVQVLRGMAVMAIPAGMGMTHIPFDVGLTRYVRWKSDSRRHYLSLSSEEKGDRHSTPSDRRARFGGFRDKIGAKRLVR